MIQLEVGDGGGQPFRFVIHHAHGLQANEASRFPALAPTLLASAPLPAIFLRRDASARLDWLIRSLSWGETPARVRAMVRDPRSCHSAFRCATFPAFTVVPASPWMVPSAAHSSTRPGLLISAFSLLTSNSYLLPPALPCCPVRRLFTAKKPSRQPCATPRLPRPAPVLKL